MRRLVCTCFLLVIMASGYSQTTYYWVGGAGPAAFHGASANWNTVLNGSGSPRSTPLGTDILIFDGSNIGGASPATGTVNCTATTHAFGQLILQNGAGVIVQRTASSGTGNLTINGDLTAADDLVIGAGSTLTITSSINLYGLTVTLGTGATGSIAGNVKIMDANFFTSRLYVKDANALNFTNGSKCYVNNTVASDYPLGSSATVATGGINFKSGSQLIYQGGVTPYSSSTFIPLYFETGSTLILEAANQANIFVNHYLPNVIVRNNAIVDPENFYNIDTLTVEAGSTFRLKTTGGSPFAGNIINNGTFGANTPLGTTQLIMLGTVPQTISGTGTFTDVANLAVAADADVTINNNLSISGGSTSNIMGKLNTQTYTIGGSGDIQWRTAASVTSNGTLSSNNTVVLDPAVYATGINTANVAVGAKVSGTGIPVNTYVVSTNSATSTFTISKAATITTASLAASITISSNAATLETANAGGVDGTIVTTGIRTFATGSNYIFDAATTAPFSTSTSNTTGNVTFNASATTNKTSQKIGGTLTINSGKLTIRSSDLLEVTSGNAIGGAPFSSSKYIISQRSGNNLGVLRMDNLPIITTLFPVGTVNYYLPVTVTPVSTSDYAVSVFSGVTEDGTPTGTPFSAARKANVVDAVWIVDRPTGLGNCFLNLSWDAALEGSSFTAYANSNIGISQFNGPDWGICLGTGDNTANTATAQYSTSSPFGVGYTGAILAADIKNISASIKSNTVAINWSMANEEGILRYEIEKSENKTDFTKIGSAIPAGKEQYEFTDAAALTGITYYRIKVIGLSGEIKYSQVVLVKPGQNMEISIYPNPVTSNINIQIPNQQGSVTIELVNMDGRIIFSGSGSLSQTNAGLNMRISILPRGVYTINVKNAGNVYRGKFVKM